MSQEEADNINVLLMVAEPDEMSDYHDLKDKVYSISSTKLASVFGCGNISKYKFWKILRGDVQERRWESYSSRRGRKEEPVSAQKFSNLTGYVLKRRNCTPLFKDTRLCATPDRLFFNIEQNQMEGLELKNPDTRPIPKKLEKDMISHVFQCIMNLEVFEVEVWNLFYYDSRTGEYSWFRIKRNEEFFDSYILKEVHNFLDSISKNQPPPERSPNGTKGTVAEFIYKNHKIIHFKYQPPQKENLTL